MKYEVQLKPLTLEDCRKARQWRNDALEAMRTPYPLTDLMQEDFYRNVICNKNSSHRYWGIWHDCGDLQPEEECIHLVGVGGITYIQRENSIGEISLILDPEYRGKGLGEAAANKLLTQAFLHLNLKTVCGECYRCNTACGFWEKLTKEHNGYITKLPNRKYWDGKYWDSIYFSIDRGELESS